MRIESVKLCNFRLYKGENKIDFPSFDGKNIFLISGENGFGKTTFLHSIIWCLYGRLIVGVEPNIRKEIANTGYNVFLKSNINNDVRAEYELVNITIKDKIKRYGYTPEHEYIKKKTQYSVSIEFSNVVIPSLPCTSLKITRLYDILLDKESVEILIDNAKNELTTEIGPEVFINDFILNNDIARLFFFDSEQIVTLSETSTLIEKRRLCSAYNEVLGVRKYEELKKNLENLRIRFRRNSIDCQGREELAKLIEENNLLTQQIENNERQIKNNEDEIKQLRLQQEDLQLQLVREGNGITLQEVKRIEETIKDSKKKDDDYKKLMRQFLEYAPIAISGNLLKKTKEQIVKDHNRMQSYHNQQGRNEIVSKMTNELLSMMKSIQIDPEILSKLQNGIFDLCKKYKTTISEGNILISLSDQDYEEFIAIYNNVTTTYKTEFERLIEDYKNNKRTLDRNQRRLSNIRNKENDEIIKTIRRSKNKIDDSIFEKEKTTRFLHEKSGTLNQALAKTEERIKKLEKMVNLSEGDVNKDRLAESLIKELMEFLALLKGEKKVSLEKRIKSILNNLMHKEDFVGSVEVLIYDEEMDINLYTSKGERINKDSMSKGEQQLYATSILKALVEESGMQFPVFIDSPLQKFDKSHAAKIITDFYPLVSNQVILFPILHKELTAEEFSLMKPMVNSTYVIKNNTNHSYFEEVPIDKFIKE